MITIHKVTSNVKVPLSSLQTFLTAWQPTARAKGHVFILTVFPWKRVVFFPAFTRDGFVSEIVSSERRRCNLIFGFIVERKVMILRKECGQGRRVDGFKMRKI
jgi:hypothetical protein